MRRSTLLELGGMEIHEVAHVRRCFAGELAHGGRHTVVTPLPSQLGHGREMPDEASSLVATAHVGTAALGCPVERKLDSLGFAPFALTHCALRSFALLDRRGRLFPRGP